MKQFEKIKLGNNAFDNYYGAIYYPTDTSIDTRILT